MKSISRERMLFFFPGATTRSFMNHSYNWREESMKVIVQDNQIEKAIRDLKKKLTKEGFFSEIKERRFYDKPSVQRKKKMAKAAKRRRKRMRKMP
jgi:small subunit ribosomal protein S21